MPCRVDELGLELRDAFRWQRLVVCRQLFPNAETDWNRDALDAVVEVDSGPFHGSFGTTLYGHELASLRTLLQTFLDQLGQHLKTSFAFMEQGVEFELSTRYSRVSRQP